MLAQLNPVLTYFEDAHWTHRSSLELFSRLVDRILSMRVLLIVAYRPEFFAPMIGRPHVANLTINRLTRREAEALINPGSLAASRCRPTSDRTSSSVPTAFRCSSRR